MVMKVIVTPNDKGNPPGKLADAELHFSDGPLEGLKLIGFAIWERRTGAGRNVTFPARSYSVNGERRSFALLRPIVDVAAQDRIRELVLDAYAKHESANEPDTIHDHTDASDRGALAEDFPGQHITGPEEPAARSWRRSS